MNRPKILQIPSTDAPKEKLLTPQQVVDLYFPAGDELQPITADWVVRNVRPRVMLNSRMCRFYPSDVERFIASKREDAA